MRRLLEFLIISIFSIIHAVNAQSQNRIPEKTWQGMPSVYNDEFTPVQFDSVADFDAEQDVHLRYPQAYKITLSLGPGGDDQEASTSYQTTASVPADLLEFEGGQ